MSMPVPFRLLPLLLLLLGACNGSSEKDDRTAAPAQSGTITSSPKPVPEALPEAKPVAAATQSPPAPEPATGAIADPMPISAPAPDPVPASVPALAPKVEIAGQPDKNPAVAIQQQGLLPLSRIIAIARGRVRGEVIDVDLDNDDGMPEYELEILTDEGRKIEITIDARNGSIRKVEED